ncbi:MULTISPECIES: putative beta-lysine N-acetyltransferase [Thermoactinomyces]|uniref:Putative beta-lysine N-acetyltransferase n=1 Tax=Thermoactinomyces daqus TaxID=1329516 RepID=A0A7W2AI10_9BACL|nr:MULTISPECIES: putative beta-lysine N-acetyltransferase [Thermoactinomyces]MBA4543316.1 putative beta-lysine N-acetyltransferase [Thermoactinomyces daqus]MBH8598457.1 putative beta-lysine N-acetyltransferase [Thermoactinomyces sp. CICC 10523]MBH8604698.1 putative beta-lysine N-acetyltransferase [Thermoactinomyces sp. CICC 10522]MBH8606841.1 putative beta-lysine N-acetyltransferase [Thermoactinomyces sp. CICC 10521]
MTAKQPAPQSVSYEVDEYNSRIKLMQYKKEHAEALVQHLEDLAKMEGIGKVLIYAAPEDVPLFEKLGFHQEGEISGFFDGDPACILSRFLQEERANSKDEEKKDEIVEMAEQVEQLDEPPELEPGFELRHADHRDAEQLAELYRLVFKTYPTPIHDPEFILECMDNEVYFSVITHQGKIVSAASADVFAEYNSAEITDCATHPDYRGKGLLSVLIFDLEKRMKEKGVPNLFSLTRAVSTGMNMVISKLGFTYKGRLIQNSQIAGEFEDMNIWVKEI